MKIKFFLFWLCFVALFCALGVWQVARYHEKKQLIDSYQQQLTAIPVAFDVVKQPKDFQHVSVHGDFLNEDTLFIQNRFYHDRLGYEVLTILKTPQSSQYVLVDRGWVPSVSEKHLPSIEPITGMQNLTGYLKSTEEYQFILGQNILDTHARPLVAQKIDLTELEHIFHHALFPYIVRLDKTAPDGFVRDWVITTVMPERHLGYAVQWFLMAIVLLIVSVRFCFRCEKCKNSASTRRHSRWPLYSILGVFIVPMILAGIFFYAHHFFHFKQLNHGELITPPVALSNKIYATLNQNNVKHRWLVLQIANPCNLNCQVMHSELLQVQKALGNNRDRVFILNRATPVFSKQLPGDIFLIDPLGNVFMSYPKNTNPLFVLQDLKKVLEVSQIG